MGVLRRILALCGIPASRVAVSVALGTLTDDGLRAITPDEKLAEGETVSQWLVIIDNLQRVRLNELVDAEMPAAAKTATATAAK